MFLYTSINLILIQFLSIIETILRINSLFQLFLLGDRREKLMLLLVFFLLF